MSKSENLYKVFMDSTKPMPLRIKACESYTLETVGEKVVCDEAYLKEMRKFYDQVGFGPFGEIK